MTLDDLKIDYTKYTTQDLMNLLPKTIQWKDIDGYYNPGYSLVINYDNMSASYKDSAKNYLIWRRINGYSVEDLNDALYLLLVDLINGNYMEMGGMKNYM